MDTKDPRFVSAYNELVNAFFRFINVVNPAPSRSDQIRLICDSMTSLVEMLQNVPEENAKEEDCNSYSEKKNVATAVTESSSEHVQEGISSAPENPDPSSATETFSEKRYAKEPTLTGEDVNKFLNRQLKKDNPTESSADDIDPDDYIFIIEFDPETEKGIFYLNEEVGLFPVFSGGIESGVVVLENAPKQDDYKIVSKGKIVKSTGGWEIIEPLVIGRNR
ncbi:MAG: hypothetical protein K2K81_03785 [Muribaculaceae bacterium]|nr:hypothetical protein [Muribaculaceae bacterium]